jgi:hypothetical protein
MDDESDTEFLLLEEQSGVDDLNKVAIERKRAQSIMNRGSLTKDQSVLFEELCRVLDARKQMKNGKQATRKSKGGKAEDEQSLLEENLNEVTMNLFHLLWKDNNIEDSFSLASLHWARELSSVRPARRDIMRIRQALLRLKAQGITRFVSLGCQTGCYEWFLSNFSEKTGLVDSASPKPADSLVIEGIDSEADSHNSRVGPFIRRYPLKSQQAARLFDYRHSQDKICLIFVNIDPDYYEDFLKLPNVHRICAIERCDSSGSDDYLSFVNSPVYGWENVKDIAGEECYVAIFERMTVKDEGNWQCSLGSLFCGAF